MTQNEQILKHLQDGHKITPMEALRLYGCFRLSARILELRKSGWQIDTANITEGKKTFAEYSMSNDRKASNNDR